MFIPSLADFKEDLGRAKQRFIDAVKKEDAKSREAHEDDLANLNVRRKDDHDYGVNGTLDIFTRTWVIEGKRGKVAYAYKQDTEPNGDVIIMEKILLIARKPIVDGQDQGLEGMEEYDSKGPMHPSLRGDNIVLVYRELANIYDAELPAL